MGLLNFLKILLVATLLIAGIYYIYNWVEEKVGVKESRIRYSSEEVEDPFEYEEQIPPLQDCYRHLDPTVIEMCFEETAKKARAGD
jgi:hypothetical protein